ncbi:Dam family site-specific DNA-(adenine-N6)-methyltransferase [Mesorhizobium sp. M0938]
MSSTEHLRDDPERLHAAYAALPGNPEQYYRVRVEYNQNSASLERAAQFLYLNRHCFNGIYRVNTRGEFNVPWGGDKVGKPLSKAELIAASTALAAAKLICGDFESVVLDNIDKDSFVYMDPPYASDETRVFREYHEDSFATGDWNRFIAVLRQIDRVGARFLLSYAGAPLEARFGDWNVGHLDVTRNVGGFRATRRKHREFIAMNFTPNA